MCIVITSEPHLPTSFLTLQCITIGDTAVELGVFHLSAGLQGVGKSQFVADAARALSGTLLAVLLPALIGIARVALFGGGLLPCSRVVRHCLHHACAVLTSTSHHQPCKPHASTSHNHNAKLRPLQAARWCGSANTRWRMSSTSRPPLPGCCSPMRGPLPRRRPSSQPPVPWETSVMHAARQARGTTAMCSMAPCRTAACRMVRAMCWTHRVLASWRRSCSGGGSQRRCWVGAVLVQAHAACQLHAGAGREAALRRVAAGMHACTTACPGYACNPGRPGRTWLRFHAQTPWTPKCIRAAQGAAARWRCAR